MAHYWLKLWLDILDDPKMGTLPDNLWRRTIEIFLIAKRFNGDGELPPIPEIGWALRLTPEQVVDDLQGIAVLTAVDGKPGIVQQNEVGEWFVTNFKKRQAKVDQAERKRRQRERDRAGHVTDTPPSPPSHEPVTSRDTEQSRADQSRQQSREEQTTEQSDVVAAVADALVSVGMDDVDAVLAEATPHNYTPKEIEDLGAYAQHTNGLTNKPGWIRKQIRLGARAPTGKELPGWIGGSGEYAEFIEH